MAAARLPLPGSSRGGRGPRGLFSLCVASVSRSAPAGRLLLSDCLHTGVSVGLSVGVLPGDNGPAHTAWGHGDMSSVRTSDAGSPSRASLGLLCGLALRCDDAPGCHLGSEHLSGLTAWEAGEEDTFILDPAGLVPLFFLSMSHENRGFLVRLLSWSFCPVARGTDRQPPWKPGTTAQVCRGREAWLADPARDTSPRTELPRPEWPAAGCHLSPIIKCHITNQETSEPQSPTRRLRTQLEGVRDPVKEA